MAGKEERAELLELIVRHSFERRKVVLASGKESDFYLDLRTTMLRPRGLQLAGQLLFDFRW
jgi:orotate phosphoribosyltransferase